MIYSKQPPEFMTITCLNWIPVSKEDRFKGVITGDLGSPSCCIWLRDHVSPFHSIWQMVNDHNRADVQRDFLKYTGQQRLKRLKEEGSELLNDLLVQTSDRKYQVWERNSLSIALWSQDVLTEVELHT
jgi:putative transposase